MDIFNKRHKETIAALLTATMMLVVMCFSNAFIVSSASWFTYATPPRNENLIFAGYSAAVTDFNPLQYDSGSMGFDVGIMYEPLFGQNLATGQQINWLGKSITWVNSTAIDVVLRTDIYWVNLTSSGPVYYRPITAQDVNYTFWLYGGFYSSGSWCTYLNGLRDRLENNGTNNDLNSFVILSPHEFVIRLNPAFANSDVAFRAISKNVLIVPYDVWTQIMADQKDPLTGLNYTANPLSFANDWCPDGVQAMPQAWMVASGMYLPWYHNTVESVTIMKRNNLWWGANDTDFGREPLPLYIENYFFQGNQDVPSAVEYGDIDWDGNYIAGLETIMTPTAFPNVHTYFWNLPYFVDGSALCIVPNHREYPVGEPWLARAIAECINYTAVSAVDSYYLRTPSVLLLPVDDAIARQLVNTTIENEYEPTYNPTDALAILNNYTFIGDGTGGTIKGMRYTKYGPSAQELATYPEYSSGDSAVTNLPTYPHVPIPTVGVGGTWNLIDIQGWTDVDAADQIVCYSVQQNLGINLVSDLLGPAGWSPAYVDAMNYVHGNSSFDFADYCMEGALNNNMFERYTQFFTGAYEGTWNHYGSYRNPTLVTLIDSLDTVPAGSAAQQNIANQIETIVGSQMPIIPEGGHPNWYIYSDKYWIGFADQYSNALLPCGPYIGRANEAALQLGIWRLHPKNFDLNGDGKVDMTDIGIVSKAFGSTPGSPGWNTIADIYDTRQIDMSDIGAVARAFGTTYVYP
jgi:hypothetical protein